jgi:hypothetical protein
MIDMSLYRVVEYAKSSPQGCIIISRCSMYHSNTIYVNGNLTVSVLVCYKSFTTGKHLEAPGCQFTDVSEECIASVFWVEG